MQKQTVSLLVPASCYTNSGKIVPTSWLDAWQHTGAICHAGDDALPLNQADSNARACFAASMIYSIPIPKKYPFRTMKNPRDAVKLENIYMKHIFSQSKF